MEYMESAIEKNKINASVISPKIRIGELQGICQGCWGISRICFKVIEGIEEQYKRNIRNALVLFG